MKRNGFFRMALVVAALLAGIIPAENKAYGKSFSWGPKAGINMAKLSIDDAKSRAGFVGGLFATYRFHSGRIGLQVEALYSQQGTKEKDFLTNGQPLDLEHKYKTQFLNVPVLINGYVTPNLALKVGVQAGFLLQAKKTTEQADGSKATTKVKGDFRAADFSIPVGISYDIWHFVIDARYNIGILDAWSNGQDDAARNNVWSITVGYRF